MSAPVPVALSPTPVLRTARLVLRAPNAADWPAFRDFTRDDRSRFVRAAEMTDEMAWRGFGHVIGHWVLRGFGMFIVTEQGQDAGLGMVGPWMPEGWPEPEIGWSMWTAGVEGRGYAFEAAEAARDWVWQTLGWTRFVSYIDPANTRSQALARRLGCTVDPGAPYPGDEAVQVWRHPEGGAA